MPHYLFVSGFPVCDSSWTTEEGQSSGGTGDGSLHVTHIMYLRLLTLRIKNSSCAQRNKYILKVNLYPAGKL